jgi:uncharacterized protein
VKRLLRLGFDIDGVLANFTEGFLSLVNRECGTSFSTSDWITYGSHTAHPDFLTKEQWDAGWKALGETPNFWATLKPYEVDFTLLDQQMDTLQYNGYFITRRRDVNVGMGDSNVQTRMWLENQGVKNYSAVISNKGTNRIEMLKNCEVDAYIDDWGEQFLEASAAGISSYLIDRPYNRHIDTDRRVYSVQEYVSRATGGTPAVVISNPAAVIVTEASNVSVAR